MAFDWSRVADWVGTALAIITLGGRQQYLKGKNAQKFYDFEKKVKNMKEQVDRHETLLEDGGQAFVRIDEKLKALKDTVDNGFQRVESQSAKTNDLVVQHFIDSQKENK